MRRNFLIFNLNKWDIYNNNNLYLLRRVSHESISMNVREQRKRFLLYCLYAWGLSFLVSIQAIIADSTDILPDCLQPDIGSRSCWFTRELLTIEPLSEMM